VERFFWRDAQERRLDERFSVGTIGYHAWRRLVRTIYDVRPEAPAAVWYSAFDEFRRTVAEQEPSKPQTCCLFVSHRMADLNNALHVAWVATQCGYDYWLDVHDPVLIGLSSIAIPSPAKDILIAAIIEMALLNVTHVIALHTQYSIGSKWIPYEFGRAKDRILHSVQAAGWFDRHTPPSSCGEYVHLAEQAKTSADIRAWLSRARQNVCEPSNAKRWPHGGPPPLDE
jgi:hypothetical protein